MSIMNRMKVQRETAREAATQAKPQELSADVKAQVQQAGIALVKSDVSQVKEAGYNGQIVKPQERRQEPPTQGY
jgi:hypothetical protein